MSGQVDIDPVVLQRFGTDPLTGVAVLTIEGDILYMNAGTTRLLFGEPTNPEDLIGKNLREIGMPEEWVTERLKLFEVLKESKKAFLMRSVLHGMQHFSWVSPIEPESDEEIERVLITVRRCSTSQEAEYLRDGAYKFINSNFVQLGNLDTLTAREIEVLALLGQGLSVKAIAKTLFRSASTIENHRDSIGKKLAVSRGVELALIAHNAGLVVEDARRIRLKDE